MSLHGLSCFREHELAFSLKCNTCLFLLPPSAAHRVCLVSRSVSTSQITSKGRRGEAGVNHAVIFNYIT